VASVQAQRGEDYVPVADIEGCLTKVLKAAESLADCKSILVPLFGTGTARADLAPTVERLIRAAIVHLETSKGPIEIVYFLVGTDVALETCRKILDESKSVEPE
jgi:hypothetical protein